MFFLAKYYFLIIFHIFWEFNRNSMWFGRDIFYGLSCNLVKLELPGVCLRKKDGFPDPIWSLLLVFSIDHGILNELKLTMVLIYSLHPLHLAHHWTAQLKLGTIQKNLAIRERVDEKIALKKCFLNIQKKQLILQNWVYITLVLTLAHQISSYQNSTYDINTYQNSKKIFLKYNYLKIQHGWIVHIPNTWFG